MDLQSGVAKLARIIKARKALNEKLKSNPDNKIINDTIAEHTRTIEYIKKTLKFDEVFEIPKACTCPVEDACKAGEIVEEIEEEPKPKKKGRKKKDGAKSS